MHVDSNVVLERVQRIPAFLDKPLGVTLESRQVSYEHADEDQIIDDGVELGRVN